jgi:Holliday junction DNA helicase RuvB
VGKTRFADSLAMEVGIGRKTLFAARAVRVVDVVASFTALQPFEILFVDEAHSLGEDEQQVLYRALDEREIPVVVGRRVDRAAFRKVEPFSLVLATNQPGRLLPALRRRVEPLVFLPYSVPELAWIGRRLAEGMGVELSAQAARRLAEVAHGAPARIRRRLETLRTYWPKRIQFGQEHVERVLGREGVDARGLNPHQRHYLQLLATAGGQTIRRLAIALGVDHRYVADEVEPDLVFAGYVNAGDGPGRTLTAAGQELVVGLAGVEPCISEEPTP